MTDPHFGPGLWQADSKSGPSHPWFLGFRITPLGYLPCPCVRGGWGVSSMYVSMLREPPWLAKGNKSSGKQGRVGCRRRQEAEARRPGDRQRGLATPTAPSSDAPCRAHSPAQHLACSPVGGPGGKAQGSQGQTPDAVTCPAVSTGCVSGHAAVLLCTDMWCRFTARMLPTRRPPSTSTALEPPLGGYSGGSQTHVFGAQHHSYHTITRESHNETCYTPTTRLKRERARILSMDEDVKQTLNYCEVLLKSFKTAATLENLSAAFTDKPGICARVSQMTARAPNPACHLLL